MHMAKTKTRKVPESPEATDVALVDDVIGELEKQLAVVATRREALAPGAFDRDLAVTAAQLGKVAISGAAERRNQRKAATSLTREAVMSWLFGLDRGNRQEIVRELQEHDDDERSLF